MTDIFVTWYDEHECPHYSPVYFVDSVQDRFLIVDEDIGHNHILKGD